MATYQEITAQIEALQRQAEDLRRSELSSAIKEINAKIAAYGLTPGDLSFPKSAGQKAGKPVSTVKAKYRDPDSGKTWTGRGKEPKWIAGKDRSGFAIK